MDPSSATNFLFADTRERLKKPLISASLRAFADRRRLPLIVQNCSRWGQIWGPRKASAEWRPPEGISNGELVERSWHLLAEVDDGPFIPSMAIEGLVRESLNGQSPKPGARPATHALELSDYDRLFGARTIYTGFREKRSGEPVYRHILGSAFDSLPGEVRALDERQWSGTASVQRGQGLLAWIIATLIGFPKAADTISVAVTLRPDGNGEKWTRTFGTQSFSSRQQCGSSRNANLLVERFGIAEVALALIVDGDKLCLVPRQWSALGIPLPKALLPKGTSFETQREGRFFASTLQLRFR